MNYRPMTTNDYEVILKFWKDHYEVSKRDDYNHIKVFIDKNPSLSTVAVNENGDIVGTVLASFDGRKGYIQKMAINTDLRGKGYGKEMLKHTIDKLKKAGALDIRVNCSEKNASFYEKCGFTRKSIVSLQIRDY